MAGLTKTTVRVAWLCAVRLAGLPSEVVLMQRRGAGGFGVRYRQRGYPAVRIDHSSNSWEGAGKLKDHFTPRYNNRTFESSGVFSERPYMSGHPGIADPPLSVLGLTNSSRGPSNGKDTR